MAAAKNKMEDDRVMLSSAITDIQKELNHLISEKSRVNSELKLIIDTLSKAQSVEQKYKNKLALLQKREDDMDKRKEKLKEKLEAVKTKITKIHHIKDQLVEV